jgi:hypothetical protein
MGRVACGLRTSWVYLATAFAFFGVTGGFASSSFLDSFFGVCLAGVLVGVAAGLASALIFYNKVKFR